MNLANSLYLIQQNEIPVLELDHPVGKARIALQGAQLLSWQPRHAEHDIFWLSPIEPFKRGVAIRGAYRFAILGLARETASPRHSPLTTLDT